MEILINKLREMLTTSNKEEIKPLALQASAIVEALDFGVGTKFNMVTKGQIYEDIGMYLQNPVLHNDILKMRIIGLEEHNRCDN